MPTKRNAFGRTVTPRESAGAPGAGAGGRTICGLGTTGGGAGSGWSLGRGSWSIGMLGIWAGSGPGAKHAISAIGAAMRGRRRRQLTPGHSAHCLPSSSRTAQPAQSDASRARDAVTKRNPVGGDPLDVTAGPPLKYVLVANRSGDAASPPRPTPTRLLVPLPEA